MLHMLIALLPHSFCSFLMRFSCRILNRANGDEKKKNTILVIGYYSTTTLQRKL